MSADTEATKELRQKMVRAFAHRSLPIFDASRYFHVDSDVEDALWFCGRDWRSITCRDWQKHNCAVHFLPLEAFPYYLQSLLILTIENPESYPDIPVASVIFDLDRTPGGGLDGGPADRYYGLSADEYAAMKEWLLYICSYPGLQGFGRSVAGPGERFGRAVDTLDRLEKMAAEGTEGGAGSAAIAR